MAIDTEDYGAPEGNSWKTPAFRQFIVAKLEQAIQKTGVQLARTSSELEDSVYLKASDQPEYLILIIHLLQYIKEMSLESSKPKDQDPQGTLNQHDFTSATMNGLQNLNL